MLVTRDEILECGEADHQVLETAERYSERWAVWHGRLVRMLRPYGNDGTSVGTRCGGPRPTSGRGCGAEVGGDRWTGDGRRGGEGRGGGWVQSFANADFHGKEIDPNSGVLKAEPAAAPPGDVGGGDDGLAKDG